MAQVPAELRYSKTHEWVRVEGNTAVIGITDHAQHELTDVVFVEVPAVGRKLKAGDACAVVESVKTASDLYSPVSGEVFEANSQLSSDPGLVNREPYSGGWFYKVRLENPAELEGLLTAEAYGAQIGAGQ